MGMTKYLLIALVAIAAALGGWGTVQHLRLGQAQEALSSAQERVRNAEAGLTKAHEAAALLRAASLARQQELNRLRKLAEDQSKALNEALRANSDWSDAHVPRGVYDALTAPLAPGPTGPGVDGASPGAPAPGADEPRPRGLDPGPAPSPG